MDNSKIYKLAPCPWCNALPDMFYDEDCKYRLECKSCKTTITFRLSDIESSHDKAVEKWNSYYVMPHLNTINVNGNANTVTGRVLIQRANEINNIKHVETLNL